MAEPDIKQAIRETLSLLDNENITTSAAALKTDTPEKEIAAEYVSAYSQFIKDIAEIDTKRGVTRADYEIRELVGHVNAMLKRKYDDIFMKMLLMCPKHYKSFMVQSEKKPEAKKTR